MTIHTFQRGETISLALDAVAGDPLTATQISAAMKAVAPGRTSAAPGAPVAAAFTINARAADAEHAAGWTMTVPAGVSANLGAGTYVADARVETADGTVTVSDAITIRLLESVSA